MEDKLILKIAEATASLLGEVALYTDSGAHTTCETIVPSYNALLSAAKENHASDKFLTALPPIDANGSCTKFELEILLTQLRLALEALGPGAAAK